jgi:Methyltransferase domain
MPSVARQLARVGRYWYAIARGRRFDFAAVDPGSSPVSVSSQVSVQDNPLRRFFERRSSGPGVHKWDHYFEIYDRHFSRFRDREIHLLEIGVQSGGSLDMWREYFGPQATIYGVDINPTCKKFEGDRVRIFVGDQADRSFWKRMRRELPTLDIIIDDGGHAYEQQVVTFEQLLPMLKPGGVYLCEDIHGISNGFAGYVSGFLRQINHWGGSERLEVATNSLQKYISSAHIYPYVVVLERSRTPIEKLHARRAGSDWI